MGKYMRKSSKTTVGVATGGEISIMESSSPLGVKTRAKTKTLALQRLQSSLNNTSSSVGGGSSYLQLRSRRLEKPQLLPHDSKRQRRKEGNLGLQNPKNPNSNSNCCYNTRASSRLKVESKCVAEEVRKEEKIKEENGNDDNNEGFGDLGVEEGCFGENCLDFEPRERSTRESTPCSLIRDPDVIRTPGSTTRPSSSADANRILQNGTRRHIPTANEMDEFFAGAEEQQQREFIEKYNFDPVNDKPLPGRYEWIKVDP